jgi:molecular chaperone DnaJ
LATKRDFYEVLGVSKSSTLDEIKKAYRTLARKHHPDVDKSASAAERFKEISEAYQVLSDSNKRQAYDQFGHAAFDRTSGGGPGAGFGGSPYGGYRTYTYTTGGGPNVEFDFGDFQDPFSLFEEILGGAATGRARTRSGGNDQHYELTIDFKDAVYGVTRHITYDRQTLCPVCLGTGAEKGSKLETCPECRGTGRIERVQNTILGQIATASVCPTCQGEGKIVKNPCHRCRGEGRIRETVSQEVKIPAGVGDGDTVRFPGLGDVGRRGTKAGDLYLTIRVLPSKVFNRRGNEIFIEVEIDLPTAVLGDVIEVPTLKEKVKLKIPAGTQSGTEFRLRGLGVPGRGDLFVKVNLTTPTKLSRQERDLWERLSKT